jgi:hypothetical protein
MEYRIKAYKDFKGSKFPAEVAAVINGVEMLALYVDDFRILEDIDANMFGKPTF